MLNKSSNNNQKKTDGHVDANMFKSGQSAAGLEAWKLAANERYFMCKLADI